MIEDEAKNFFGGKIEKRLFEKLSTTNILMYDEIYNSYLNIHQGRRLIEKMLLHKVIVKGGECVLYLPPTDRINK
ncbi:MAG: hypothetical protein WCL18_10745 [bacterium]